MARMTNDTVDLHVTDGVATLTLDRPASLNSMSLGLMDDIREAVEAVDADGSARVLVITGAGRGFCSGADLAGVVSGDAAAQQASDDPTESMDRNFHPAIRAIKACRVPTVARINGVTAGAGIGLAMACDVTIAARSAFFVATFGPRLGIVPDCGTTWHLPLRAGRAKALGMALLGDRVSADDAERWGLVYAVVDDDRLDDEIARVVDVLKRSSPEATRRIRTSIDTAADRTLDEQLELERDHQRVLIPMNLEEGARAFVEKRDPDFGRTGGR